ncbi:MAG TPA: ATP-grasp domain-containing protein [Flavobacterium sp.]|jgi:carbamoyl-phosphate synthase large subunit
MNILFTCAGRRNYLINYFKEALNGKGKVFATDMQQSAPAMIDADVALIVPGIYADSYIPTLKKIIGENNIRAVISLNDLELPILSKYRDELEQSGAKLIVSAENVIDIAFDKVRTAEFLTSIGVLTPKTFFNIDRAKEALNEGTLKFPLVVKPRWGSASIGIDFPADMEDLELSFRLQHKRLNNTILSTASGQDLSNAILIQEKIPGKEYGMDILNDFEGNYIGTFAREKLAMRSGETDKAMSVVDERFEALGKMISEKLKHIGNLDCDVFESDGELYVLELNPRFGGGYPFSHEAGVNTPEIYISLLEGERNVQEHINYKHGVMFSKCDRLIAVN